jgi:superfamily II DNA or RNA helicase
MAAMPATAKPIPSRKSQKKRIREPQYSRQRKPEGMSLADWQIALRRQHGRKQDFVLKNLGEQPIFSEFEVTNPQSQSSYRVMIRGAGVGDNYCTCPDFSVSALGTCKHIEFALGRLEKRRGGKKALQAGYQPSFSEVYLQYGARREVRFRPGADCPVELARLAADYFGEEGHLREESFSRFETFLGEAGRFENDLRCAEDALGFVAEVRDAQNRHERLKEAFPRGIHSAAWKRLLRVSLYDYQREGALFAAGAGRCLIGDEMGLGKTIQAIAAAEIMARLFGVERALIVSPTSLKHQWEREINRFTERSVETVGGVRSEREQGFASDSFFKIVNYDTVHRDLDLIRAWSPDVVILDEAQRIKNWNTRTARTVKRIVSPFAIVLTGTPLENRLEELISIVQFVDRFRLGPTYRLLNNHQVQDDHGRVIGYRNLDQIGKTLQPVLIRRQKSQVLDQLPGRLDKNFFVPMTPQQQDHHDENRDIVAKIVHKWKRYHFLSEADQRRLMIALQNMRMACDSTYLLDHQSDFGVKAEEFATLLAEIHEEPETKVVVFSQWLRMHELLVRRLQNQKWEHILFHGGVPGTERRKLVDRFREEPDCRVFLATDAGGVGLNLQHASVVINMDLPWNPAVLEQRIGRVHRLGQRQPVRVINFVAKNTIEEGMLGVLRFKKSLFAGVLDGGEKEVFLGGTRLTRFMQTVEKTTESIPSSALDEPAPAEEAAADEAPARAARPFAPMQPKRRPEDKPALARTLPVLRPDPWTGLLQNGLEVLKELTASGQHRSANGHGPTTSLSLLRRDETTGETYLRLPVANPGVLEQTLTALAALFEGLVRKGAS